MELPFVNWTVLTGLDCNLRCKYCYEKNKNGQVNTFPVIKQFFDAMFEQEFGAGSKSGIRKRINVDYIGGEPLLHPQLLDQCCGDVMQLAKRYNTAEVRFSLTTNGTCFKNPDVQEFCKKWNGALDIGFSIDGTKDIHDAMRVDASGAGSYDRAVAGWNWVKTNLPNARFGVKATFTHATIQRYAESVINLIRLGFTDIGANVVFEEIWPKEEAPMITAQLIRVVDYLFDHHLENTVHLFQVNHADVDMLNYNPVHLREQNYCGACKYMRACGFNGVVYGCQRFATMPIPRPIGIIQNGKFAFSDEGKALCVEVENQYKHLPDECKNCKIGGSCPSCAAIPYEQCPDNPVDFFRHKGQCGFAYACAAARLYFSDYLHNARGIPKLKNFKKTV